VTHLAHVGHVVVVIERHCIEGSVLLLSSPLSKGQDVSAQNAPVTPYLFEGEMPRIEKAHEGGAAHAKQVCSLLRGQHLGRRADRHLATAVELAHDVPQRLNQFSGQVREKTIGSVEDGEPTATRVFKNLAQLRRFARYFSERHYVAHSTPSSYRNKRNTFRFVRIEELVILAALFIGR
jgi:hypothetical protein